MRARVPGTLVHFIKVGSRVSELQEEALKIFKAMLHNNICIEPEWVPREQNEIADSLSRIIDFDDWSINPNIFFWLDSFWGPHTVDRFANSHNTQLSHFNSRFWDVDTEAVDSGDPLQSIGLARTIGGAPLSI